MTQVEEKPSRFAQIPPRGMTKDEAAEYCGCETKAAFDSWVYKGIIPGPIPGTQRWDRKAIDRWLDRASGIISDVAISSDPLAEWQATRDAKRRAA